MKAEFMLEAIRLSAEMMRRGEGGPFGAIVVRDGRIIARGYNRVTSTNDPTAHAEIVAIRAACEQMTDFRLAGCDLYVNCEPCPMCLGAIYWAHIDRVFYAATKEDAAAIGFDDAFIYHELKLPYPERHLSMTQMLRPEAIAIFQEWQAKEDKILY